MTIEEEFQKNINYWFTNNLEDMRYDYPLNENSIVFDIGFYKGEFTKKIFNEFACQIIAFEPIEKYFLQGLKNIPRSKKIKVFNYAVGIEDKIEGITVQDDSSSLLVKSLNTQLIEIRSFSSILKELNINSIDLIKCNIEGAEYSLLEYMLDLGITNICKNIQVQFHTFVENAEERRNKIRERLKETHKLTYDFGWIWESWELK